MKQISDKIFQMKIIGVYEGEGRVRDGWSNPVMSETINMMFETRNI